MIGYDDAALAYMIERLKDDKKPFDEALARDVFNLAMAYDLDYMVASGVLREGDFTDVYYDEDDAFDFIMEHLSNAHPEWDADTLTDLLDLYTDYHDVYMEEKGLLTWE